MAPYPAPRGRPRLYLDDADRHRAFRERRQVDLDRGDIARAVLATPTPALIAQIAQLLMAKASDPASTAALLRQALESGISVGIGGPGDDPRPSD